MVKLAQHIEWSSPIPAKAGESAASAEKNRNDLFPADGKPRKTLAQLFESRVTSLPSKSLSSSALSPSSPAAGATSATPLSVRTTSSSSTSSSASPLTRSSATTVTPNTFRQLARTALPSSTQNHVTFVENGSVKHHKHAHTRAGHESSELAGGIKRSSSARKIADSSRQEGVILRTNNTGQRLSVSGPLDRLEPVPRSPLAKARNSEPGHASASVRPSNRQNGRFNENLPKKFNENLPKKLLFGQERMHLSSALTSLAILEQKSRSPFAKFRVHEHNQASFLQKSIDTVEALQNGSRFGPKEADLCRDKGLNVLSAGHITLRKEKKVRKGLFSLLTDASSGKELGDESKIANAPTWKVSGKLEKAANTPHAGGNVQDFRSPLTGTPRNEVVRAHHLAGSLQIDQDPVGNILDRSGMLDESREPTCMTVEIPDKMVGLAWIGAEPRFLTPGSYLFPSNKFVLEQVVSDKTRYLKHGSLHRVYIAEGHLGVAWIDGKAILLEAGVSVHKSPWNKFSHITTEEKKLSEKEFVLGPFRVVKVDESEVGIKFCNRQPQILYPGRHCLSISKVEVFAGFESLLQRQSYVSGASATSKDSMKVTADAFVEWQIKPEDAAAARLANITDVEGAVCCKVKRAFNLVFWEVNAHDMDQQLKSNVANTDNSDSLQLLKSLSSDVSRECQELFEEGWTVTIKDLQLKDIVIQPEVLTMDEIDAT